MVPVSLALRTDLMVRRLAGSAVEDRGDWLVVRTPANPTFHWGNHLVLPGSPGPGAAGTWEARFVAEFPQARHRAYGVDGTAGLAGDAAELAALGVVADVSTVLTAAPARIAATADDAHTRALGRDGDWEQLVALRAAVHGPDDGEFVARRVTEVAGLVASGAGRWFGCLRDGRLVAALGIVSDGHGLARYQDVETDPGHQRQGLARALLRRAAVHARDEYAARTLVIVADPDHHAATLYRSVGFTDVEQQVQLAGSRG